METEKTFADSKRKVCLGTGEAKFEVEYQESLPQYCEDVERVVRCVCSHAVTDYEYASGSLRVTGRSRISLVYISTSGCCLSAAFEERFTKNIDAPVTDTFAFCPGAHLYGLYKLSADQSAQVRGAFRAASPHRGLCLYGTEPAD